MLEKLRRALEQATEKFQAAHRAIQEAGDDADLAALEAALDTADGDVRSAQDAYDKAIKRDERAREVAEARASLPVEPVEDTPVEERRDPARPKNAGSEPATYRQDDMRTSYFRDLALRKIDGDTDAGERLQRHRREMEARAINSTDGTGGEFVPPLWMQEEWIKLAKAGRAFADACRHMALPNGTDTINFPSVATGATVAAQADAGNVSSTDISTSSYSVGVKTIAGQQDLSQQLLDRSVPGIDVVVFEELGGRYAIQLDTQCLSGSGAGANAQGIDGLSGVNTVTVSSTSVTGAGGLYTSIANAIQQIHTTRFLPPSAIVMHPRRWAAILAAADGQNRPLVVPAGQGFNQVGLLEQVAPQAVVGQMQGLPVIADPNIATNKGAGTNEDRVYVARLEDLWLMEDSPIRTRVLSEVLSNTLQVRVQLYNYFAFAAGRYPKSIAVLSGAGLATPSI